MIEGTYTALVTPFNQGKVDEDALRKLVNRQIDGGVEGLVPCGTTGETPTLSHEEYERVIAITIDENRGRLPVVAGTGTNNTETTIAYTQRAKEMGADGALIVTPYYNKPPQHALVAHYQAVCEAVQIPVVLYNVPGRTGCNMSPETAAELSWLDNVVALKDAAGSIMQTQRTIELCADRLNVVSGDDALAFPMFSIGAKGVISVTSNVAPNKMSEIYRTVQKGDFSEARRLHYELLPLMRDLFIESNPTPSKAAMHWMGLLENEVRMPLMPLSEKHYDRLKGLLNKLNLL